MDPLSEVLAPLNSQNAFFGGLKAGGDWAVHFPAPQSGKFNAVVRGGCWLAAEGLAEPLRLAAGDCLLLTRSLPVTVGSDLSLPALDADVLYLQAKNGVASCGEAEDCLFIGGSFTFGEEVERLLGSLPALMVIRGGTEEAAVLQWALQRLADELLKPSPGSALMTHHLGQIMLTQALRIYLTGRRARPPAGCPPCSIRASAPRCRQYTPILPVAGRWRHWPMRRAFPVRRWRCASSRRREWRRLSMCRVGACCWLRGRCVPALNRYPSSRNVWGTIPTARSAMLSSA